MPFRDPILGGDALVRTAMRSPNYAAGASGWRIARDGSVEFNNGTFRGRLSAGADPGQHFVINPGTGDIVDAYDSSNRLIFSIDQLGTVTQISYGLGTRIDIQDGDIAFRDIGNLTPQSTPQIFFDSTGAYRLFFNSGSHQPSNNPGELYAQGESGNNTKDNALYGQTRGLVIGNLIQNDNGIGAPVNNLVRMGHFNVTTGPSGVAVFANAASFPIVGALILFDQTAKAAGIWCSGAFNYGTTTLNSQWLQWSGAAVVTYNNSAVSGTYIAWG